MQNFQEVEIAGIRDNTGHAVKGTPIHSLGHIYSFIKHTYLDSNTFKALINA